MNFLSVSDNGYLAFTGCHYIHIYSTRHIPKASRKQQQSDGSGAYSALTSLDLTKHLPSTYNESLDYISSISCSIAKDASKLVAVDSQKHVYVFTSVENFTSNSSIVSKQLGAVSLSWNFFTSFKMAAKILHAQFDASSQNLLMVDKHGVVYFSPATTAEGISKTIQLVGHAAGTTDLLQNKLTSFLMTCDGYEKFFKSTYPPDATTATTSNATDSKIQQLPMIGQSHSPVVNIALLYHDRYVLSAHVDGQIKVWSLTVLSSSNNIGPLHSWDIFKVVHGQSHRREDEHEIHRCRLTEVLGGLYTFLAIKIATYTELPIFQMDIKTNSMRKLGSVKMDYIYTDFRWFDDILYVYNPAGTAATFMKKFKVSDNNGVLYEPNFTFQLSGGHHSDLKSFVTFNQNSFGLNKYFSSDLVALGHGRQLMDEFYTSKAIMDRKRAHRKVTPGSSGADASSNSRDLETKSSLGTLQEQDTSTDEEAEEDVSISKSKSFTSLPKPIVTEPSVDEPSEFGFSPPGPKNPAPTTTIPAYIGSYAINDDGTPRRSLRTIEDLAAALGIHRAGGETSLAQPDNPNSGNEDSGDESS